MNSSTPIRIVHRKGRTLAEYRTQAPVACSPWLVMDIARARRILQERAMATATK